LTKYSFKRENRAASISAKEQIQASVSFGVTKKQNPTLRTQKGNLPEPDLIHNAFKRLSCIPMLAAIRTLVRRMSLKLFKKEAQAPKKTKRQNAKPKDPLAIARPHPLCILACF
jgi:hypothetical protein